MIKNDSENKEDIIRSLVNKIFIGYFLLVSIVSILFLLKHYKILVMNFVQNHLPLLYKLHIYVSVNEFLIGIWGLNIIIFILWWYFFINKKSALDAEDSYKSLVDFVDTQEKSDKLLGYMISQSWGRVLWSGEVFAKIFKMGKQSKGEDFLNILQNQDDFVITQEQIDNILNDFKYKRSACLDLSINVSSQNGAFRLIYTSIGGYYLWQIMLIKKEIPLNEQMLLDDFIKLSIPVIVLSARGILLYANDSFLEAFKIPKQVNIANIELKDLIYNSEELTSKELSWPIEGLNINKIYCKKINGENFEAIIFHQNLYKENTNVVQSIRSIMLPLYKGESQREPDLKNIESQIINQSTNEEKRATQKLESINIVNNSVENKQIIPFVDYMNSLLEEAPMGIIIMDSDNNIVSFNAYAKEMFNILNDNEDILNIFNNNKYKYEDFLNSFNQKQPLNIELEIKKDKKLFSFYSLIVEDKKISYVTDISHIKDLKSQVKLYQGLQTIGQIASVVAHDFNNLLTAIMSFAYFAQEKQDEDDPIRAELDQIKQNSNRAKVMIKQLLTFSRKQDLKPESFDVNSEISDIMSTVVRLIGDRITSNFKRGKNIGSILMDRVQFHQVLTNLVVNAKDAMKKGGKIEIITKVAKLKDHKNAQLGVIPAGDYVVIEVKDEGEGIKKEHLKAIFQSHFSTKGEKGNGLGLSTVHNIITDSAGFIDIKSVVGSGTSFYLYLPREKDNKTDEELELEKIVIENKPISLLDLTGSETILLVEDETPVRMVCSRLLKSKGYKVIEAESGDVAVEMLSKIEEKIDLVISDVMMPGMSGAELIGIVKEKYPVIKAILMSGYAEDILDDVSGDSSIKGIEFLSKPFTPDVFAAKVSEVIKTRNIQEKSNG